MTTTTAIASPAKLPTGGWGARSKTDVSVGDVVRVTTRAGKTWDAVVTRVLPGGLLETKSAKRSRPRATASDARRNRRPCGYPGCDGRSYCDECSD